MFEGYAELVGRLDRAVAAGSPDAITAQIKHDLQDLLSHAAVHLPARFRAPRPDCYARRLLHQDPAGRYAAIVMTWGPGQGTPIHDHGGLWCVEGVVEGEIRVTNYEVAPEGDGFRVVPFGATVRAGVGTAGRLIPPTDYHVLENALPDGTSVTLHVYGGDMNRCRVFTPAADGRYVESTRRLAFHE